MARRFNGIVPNIGTPRIRVGFTCGMLYEESMWVCMAMTGSRTEYDGTVPAKYRSRVGAVLRPADLEGLYT